MKRGVEEEMSLSNIRVTVKKDDLLNILRENRKKHAEEYNIAKQGYQVECVKRLKKHASQIASGKIQDISKFDTYLGLPVPQDHTEEYDSLIGMLELAQEKEFEISGVQYRQWIEDKWDWRQAASMCNSAYTVSGCKI